MGASLGPELGPAVIGHIYYGLKRERMGYGRFLYRKSAIIDDVQRS